MPAVDLPRLRRTITHANLLRLRLIAWILVATTPFLALVDLHLVRDIVPLLPGGAWWPVFLSRLVWFLASAALLFATRRVRSPDDTRPRHGLYIVGYTMTCLAVASAWAGFGWHITASISVYLLAVFCAAAFLHLGLRQALFVYGSGWAILVGILIFWRPPGAPFMGPIINATFMTLTAFLVSRLTYATQTKDFLNQRLIDRQQVALAEANRRLAELNAILERLSYLDPLTEIPNRRYFDEYLAREWSRAGRQGSSISLAMIDLDHFKQFNDSRGHLAGDLCLIEVTRAVRQVLNRPADLLARYGGDEFAVVLPDTDAVGARTIAEGILREVGQVALGGEGVTVSLGVASRRPAPGESPDLLVASADDALYRAKAAGRNRCVFAAAEAPRLTSGEASAI